jgi:acetate kinase
VKAALYDSAQQDDLLLSLTVAQVGDSSGRLKITQPSGSVLLETPVDLADSAGALDKMFVWLGEHGFLEELAAAGHRLVQGGPHHKAPERISPQFMVDIEQLVPLDPDHLPAAIRGIQFVGNKFPELPQVACFDTAFHSSLPQNARMYALPGELYEEGIVRYGFHGLSYEYVMQELLTLEKRSVEGREIIAHLGSGASIAAIKAGHSIDTSMGFTPLEGLVMGTRCGDIDAGVLLYLLEQKKLTASRLSTLLNKQSGLLGVSGRSGDMRILVEKMEEDPRSAEAVNLFCYRVKKYIGAYAAALAGVDVLVFTAGIGEHLPEIRRLICDGLDFLGIRLNVESNEANADVISH